MSKRFILVIAIFILSAISLVPLVTHDVAAIQSSNLTTKVVLDKKIPVSLSDKYYESLYKDIGPKEILMGEKFVKSVGKCSCGKTGYHDYHAVKFANYCPYCKKEGVLIYEQNPTCPEGMWVCTVCDADFCLVSGQEHISYYPNQLTKA